MKRPYVHHFAVAEACRALPGEWQPVGEYNSVHGAQRVIRDIARGRDPSAYLPAGAFEARFELTEFGAQVGARYIGDRSVDEAWADALAALTSPA